MKSTRRSISPVIATVIIVAVAIAISIAVAGWLFGLWGSLTGASPKVSVAGIGATVSNNTLNVTVSIVNDGKASDSIVSAVAILPDGSVVEVTRVYNVTNASTAKEINLPHSVGAGKSETLAFEFNVPSGETLHAGDTIEVKIVFQRSGPHTTSVMVTHKG